MGRFDADGCPHCDHGVDDHRGLPFNGGPHGEWRYRCRCGCTVDGALTLLDRDTFEPTRGAGATSDRPDPTGQPGTTEPTALSRCDVSRGMAPLFVIALGPDTSV